MRSPHFTMAGKIVVALLATAVGGFFTLIFGLYGVMGLSAALEDHLTWSAAAAAAASVYWALLLFAILCLTAVIATWLLLFRLEPSN